MTKEFALALASVELRLCDVKLHARYRCDLTMYTGSIRGREVGGGR